MCWFGKIVTYLNTSTHSNSLKPTANLSKSQCVCFSFQELFFRLSHQQVWDNVDFENMSGDDLSCYILCSNKPSCTLCFFFFFISSWNDTVNCVLKLNCTLTSEYSQGGVCVCGWAVRLCGPECWTLACPPQPAPSPDSHCQSAQMTRSLHVTNASHHTSTPHRFHLFLFCNLFVFTLIMLIWNKFSSKVEY